MGTGGPDPPASPWRPRGRPLGPVAAGPTGAGGTARHAGAGDVEPSANPVTSVGRSSCPWIPSTWARGGPAAHQASTAATAAGGPSRTASTRPSSRLRDEPVDAPVQRLLAAAVAEEDAWTRPEIQR